jgi:drug/metabolite transporter (DMT)-like permease
MPIFLVFLTFALWSTSFPIGKSIVMVSTPLFSTGARMILGGVILLTYLWFRDRKALRINKQQLIPILLLSLMAVYITNVLEFWGLKYLTSAKACFIYSLSPFITALLSYLKFGEKVTKRKWAGLLIGFIGFLPILLSNSAAEELLGGVGFISWAELALVSATACAMYGWILLRQLGKDLNMKPLMSNGSSMLIGGTLALVHSFITEPWGPFPVTNISVFAYGILIMTIISNVICYNLYGYLLKKYTATFLSFAGLTTPLFAAFFGWVILGEVINWNFLVSIGIISIGLWVVHAEEMKQGYILKKA